MENSAEIVGQDIISLPGQNLTILERNVLTGLADGENPDTIMRKNNLNRISLRHTERDIKNKLGAKTHAHIISRAFVLNILIPRFLCLFLAVLSTGTFSENPIRIRQSGRNSASSVRLSRSSKSGQYA